MKEKLSRLIKLSWDIQQNKNSTRSKALKAAWEIIKSWFDYTHDEIAGIEYRWKWLKRNSVTITDVGDKY